MKELFLNCSLNFHSGFAPLSLFGLGGIFFLKCHLLQLMGFTLSVKTVKKIEFHIVKLSFSGPKDIYLKLLSNDFTRALLIIQ